MPDRWFEKPGANLRRRREGSGPKTSPGVEVPLVAPVFLEALETLAGRAETNFQGLAVGAGRREPREGTDSLDAVLVAAAGGVCVAGHLLKETTDVGAGSGVIDSTDVLRRTSSPRRDVVRGGDAGETPTLDTMATSMHPPDVREGASG